jgi:hypothetical protein
VLQVEVSVAAAVMAVGASAVDAAVVAFFSTFGRRE